MNVAPTSAEAPEPQKRHILYVITKSHWGGAQRYVYELAIAAREKGFKVTVAVGDRGELTERLDREEIPIVIVPGLGRDISLSGDAKALVNITRLIHKLRPDIVHTNSSKAGLVGVLGARLAHVPRIIFTAHGWAFNESRPKYQKAIFAFFHLITVWLSDTVICVSEAVRKDAEWMPKSFSKFVVIHHGITPVQLESKEAARAKLAPQSPPHLSPEFLKATWIGTLAELHPTKGLDIAIKAFAKIEQQFPNAMLVLIGEGQYRNHLVMLAKELRIFDRILFCGHVRDAATLLSAFDIFLFPSRSEALGYALLEAGNASLPVIASNVGGIPEIVTEGTGILAAVGNVDVFAFALTKLLQDPELAKKLGTSLHERTLTEFSRQHMLDETLGLYSQTKIS